MAKRSSTHSHEPRTTIINNIESVININDYKAQYKKPDEYLNRPLVIMGYEMKIGDKGDFAHIEAIDVLGEEAVIISTGGGLILRALEDIQDKNGFPVLCKIGKSGNAYVFQPASVGKNVDLKGMIDEYLGNDIPELGDNQTPFE